MMSLRQLHLLVVNAITFIRVPFILAFLVLALMHGWGVQCVHVREVGEMPSNWWAIIALVCLTLSALTDLFDGALARRWKVVTKFGAMCDPLMDKVFYLIVFPTLLWLLPIGKPLERWHALFMVVLTILYLLRDQWVTFLRSVGSLYGANCAASFLGKFRTAMTFPLCGVIYLYIMLYDYPKDTMTWFRWVVYTGEAVAIFLNFWSLYVYTRDYMPYIKRSISEK
ncbi:MAG: CDP-alcohol phosphatidyltransferase family protein [Kiritimatiellae bacterium]|nr:CDP-alcohol phosphatidyltransferase family protein [Kiritimatiellia bacterium]MBR4946669.1 CDP-alcohol phosphatidyltransferase family protein [Kiritimatiellia bacterium]